MYKRNYQGWLKHLDFIIWDVIALEIAFVLAYVLRHGMTMVNLDAYKILAIIYAMVDILLAAGFNTMSGVLRRSHYREFVCGLKQSSYVLVIMTLCMFMVKVTETFSRTTILLTAVLHLILGFILRSLWKRVILRSGKAGAKTTMLLVADEKQISNILKETRPASGIEFIGLVLSNRDGEGEEISGIKVVANLSNAADYICREWVDEVFIYPEHLIDIETHDGERTEDTVSALIEQCRQMAVTVHIRLPISATDRKSFVEKVGGFSVVTATSNYAAPKQLALKRIMDILGGLAGSLIALIIIAIVGPIIKKESPGPILFTQTRIGRNGKKFKIYKIRSMYMDAEERKQELLKQNTMSDGMMFKLDFDPRIIGNKIVDGKQVTGIGDFIRTHSLDEFPQFFNVLLDQMSMVGTRPPTVDEWEKYKYHHRARLSTKPGITGLWQVSGRSKITDFEEVVKLDTEYINNWSIGLDIRILLKTIKVVLKKEGAR